MYATSEEAVLTNFSNKGMAAATSMVAIVVMMPLQPIAAMIRGEKTRSIMWRRWWPWEGLAPQALREGT
jgi:hypothetical protein